MSNLKELIGDPQSPVFQPCYILWGDEPYFIDEAVSYFENLLPPEEAEFNKTVVYGKDAKLEDILSAARRFPMMAERQVVIVKEAQELDDWRRKDGNDRLDAYLKNPVESTILVFVFKHKKPDGRMSAFKRAKSMKCMFEFKGLKEEALPSWIQNYVAQSRGKEGLATNTIGMSAARLLAEYLGADLKKVTNEIDKMMIVLPQGSEIGLKDIEENVGISKDYNVFELVKALAHKDIKKSNQIFKSFAANTKAHPIQMVLPMMYSHFAKCIVYAGLGAGANQYEAAKACGVSPYFVKDLSITCQNYSAGKLVRIMGYLREADQKSKGLMGNKFTEDSIYKELGFKILH
jgi:DNA polymerase-3 subunit delta